MKILFLILAFACPSFAGTGPISTEVKAGVVALSATGTSLNVNCTGGCGSPSQANTFVAYSTITAVAISTHVLINGNGSTVVVRVKSIQLTPYADAAVTGITCNADIVRITTATLIVPPLTTVTAMDSSGGALNASVRFYNGGGPIANFTGLLSRFGGATITTEETTLVPFPIVLYNYDNVGETELTLRANEGLAVFTRCLGTPAGKFGVRIEFKQI